MKQDELKEISRKVIGITALRLVRDGESLYCQKFESGGWKNISPLQKHQLLFGKQFNEWLEKHKNLLKTENENE